MVGRGKEERERERAEQWPQYRLRVMIAAKSRTRRVGHNSAAGRAGTIVPDVGHVVLRSQRHDGRDLSPLHRSRCASAALYQRGRLRSCQNR